MIADINEMLFKNPESIRTVLEHFGYCNVAIHSTYISCGRDEQSSKKSIVISLKNNHNRLYITDYARNINKDFYSFICTQRGVEFKDVLYQVKNALGIKDYYSLFEKKVGLFGGIYSRVNKPGSVSAIKTYDESVLTRYRNIPNTRFIKDHISIAAQRKFNIGYDIESQCITIPIYTQFGDLMGVKARCNWEVEDGEQKYYYLLPCQASKTLYGYAQNYSSLESNRVYVFESEKSVLQCYSYGITNAVALGSGSVSIHQARMIHELHPTEIILMHDTGYQIDYIKRNIAMIKRQSIFSNAKIGYWDSDNRGYEDKLSPSDKGRCFLVNVIKNEIKMIGDEITEEEI